MTDRLRVQRDEVRDRIRALERTLVEMDADRESVGRALAGGGGGTANLWAGITGFTEMHGEGAARESVDMLTTAMRAAHDAGRDLAPFEEELLQANRIADTAARGSALAGGLGAATGLQSGSEMWRDWKAERARVLIEQAIEGHSFVAGRLEQEVRLADAREGLARQAFEAEYPRRDALRAESNRRALERGTYMWPE